MMDAIHIISLQWISNYFVSITRSSFAVPLTIQSGASSTCIVWCI